MIMKKNAKYFRDAAWAQIKDNWTHAVMFNLVGLLLLLINVGKFFFDVLDGSLTIVLSVFIILPLDYGVKVTFLEYVRTDADMKMDSMFAGFKDYGRVLSTGLLMTIYVTLWTLLLIIPGIIKYISYSQVYFIMKDNPEIKNNEAIELSMAMMDGHKMELFLLSLSFIGWILFGIITFGFGLLWIVPYMCTTMAHFYEYVKDDYEHRVNG